MYHGVLSFSHALFLLGTGLSFGLLLIALLGYLSRIPRSEHSPSPVELLRARLIVLFIVSVWLMLTGIGLGVLWP
ncbi:MAG: hypothetical protein UT84_C0025G0006 [Candidatus Curtissbacteria bacterium GW2011_GWA1_40_16]|uniref:Uncharacterized protein n=1 Tax=Candidatus Curtissbacteria bacterium GW2011_GWA1_40_16 TaxID=1618405 RepID=A0A0G0RAS2_9BACT|nr:MAG: hypothetical protein UT84_C0025G0006 [Candidatus Curtissbacteria bacterium GW2011_GWA1_40_16]